MKKAIFLLMMFISPSVFSYNEKITNIESGGIDAVKMHLSHHYNTSARPIALIRLSGLEGTCSKGVFFDAKQNQEPMSIALAAIASKSSIQITYDIDTTSPWGNTTYCALTGIQIKK